MNNISNSKQISATVTSSPNNRNKRLRSEIDKKSSESIKRPHHQDSCGSEPQALTYFSGLPARISQEQNVARDPNRYCSEATREFSYAVTSNNLEDVKNAINKYELNKEGCADINAITDHFSKSNALHEAATVPDNSEILELLLNKMSSDAISQLNEYGETALYIYLNGNGNELKIVELFLSKMSPTAINTVDKETGSILHRIVFLDKSIEIFELCLPKLSSIAINCSDYEGSTLLHYVFFGDYDCENINRYLNLLLPRLSFETINSKNNEGKTALYYALNNCNFLKKMEPPEAALSESLDIMRLLLSKMSQESLDSLDNKGQSVLYYPMANVIFYPGYIERIRLLLPFNPKGAMASSVNKTISTATINSKDNEGKTALHHAAEWYHINYHKDDDAIKVSINMINLLLSVMSQEAINSKDNEGKTALHYAALWCNNIFSVPEVAIKGSSLIVNSLLSAMSQEAINSKDNEGKTALHHSCSRLDPCIESNFIPKIIESLSLKMSQEAIDSKDILGKTALHYACTNRNVYNSHNSHLEIIKLLLLKMSQDAIDSKDKEEKTALHYAAYENSVKNLVEVLLSNMSLVSINKKDIYGNIAGVCRIYPSNIDVEINDLIKNTIINNSRKVYAKINSLDLIDNALNDQFIVDILKLINGYYFKEPQTFEEAHEFIENNPELFKTPLNSFDY